jgi:ribonuclease Z
MDLSLFFVGTGGSAPSARRGLPAVLVQRGGDRLLFDCGEGTQRQLLGSVGLLDLECVFITHFHADHWLGLPGMLKSFALRDREAPLTVYGPPGLTTLMEAMLDVYGRNLPYTLNLVELESWGEVRRDGYMVASVPVNHGPRAAYGYVLVEDARPGQFDPQRARELGVADVTDFGVLQRGGTVTVGRGGEGGEVRPDQVMGPPREGRKIAISGDTAPCEALAIAAHRADVLVHEATFAHEERDLAREAGHSTAVQAAELAREAEVKLLALTHISSRYNPSELRNEARAVFDATEAPRDFDTIEVPFPERGGAVLVRWSERKAALAASAQASRPATEDAEPITSP